MKKLGLRVLAGGLAAMMTVSVLTPAKMARAENDLLIAPAPIAAINTLTITADMVDSDNEIIISGENWERIVVTKEAAAANIYFDAVEVGELVVESGSNSVIQLWDVDVSKVTVKEPELEKIDMTELRTLLAEKETSQQAIEYFMKVQAENEKISRRTPKLVTMEDAVVETISASANVRLDLHEGEVKALQVEANANLNRMNVTLEGYNGDVTYVGNKGFSVVNLKNVDSRINKLTVADSGTSNYLNVSSKDSVALNVEVAGDAKVSLNIPMGELTIAETAKAAKVDVLNAVDNMTVAADNAQVEIAPIGNVAQASITGDKVSIGGAGKLDAVEISGKDAYVSTKGTEVEGENTYVEPVYVEPKVVVKNVYDNMTAGPNELTKNSDGSATISFNGQYQTSTFNVPATVDVNRIRSITVEVTIKAQFGLSVITKGGEAVVTEYPGWGISEETKKEFTYYINPAEQKIGKIGFMSLNAGQPDMVVNSVTFTLYDEGKAPTPKPTQPPAAPSKLNLPEGSKEWQFADMLPCADGSWGNTVSEAANNGIKAEYERQYACTRFTLPETLTVGDFEKVIVTLSSATGPFGIELLDADGKVVAFWWNKKETATTDLNLTYNTVGYGGGESVSAENLAKQVEKVNVMYHGDGEGAEVILYRIAFVAKPGAGSGNTPTPTPTPPVEPGDESVSVKIVAPENTTLTIGETLQLKAETTPADKKVTWSSSNEAIATVDAEGLVEAVSAVSGGAVTITATCGEATDTVKLTVEAKTGEETPEATPTPIVVKGAEMSVSKQDDGVEVAEAADDAVTITFPGQYKAAVFDVPEDVDIDRIKEITLNVTTDAQFGLTLISKQGEGKANYPGYDIKETVTKDFSFQIDPNEWKINRISIGSLDAGQSPLTLNSITFTLYEEGEMPEATPTTPAAPSELELSEGSKEYKFADMLPCAGGNHTISDVEHNGVKVVYARQYANTKFTLSEALTLGDFEKVILTASSGKGSFGIELLDADGKVVAFWWSKNAKETTDLELTFDTTGYNGQGKLSDEVLAKGIKEVNIMYHAEGVDAEIILYRIAFIAQ